MRLIDADALLEEVNKEYIQNIRDRLSVERAITNAPTVQRQGWVSVPIEPTEEMIQAAIPEIRKYKSIQQVYKAMLSAAPTETE